jgi:peptidoglycan-N-acetylglucosamine deacetylase
MLLTKQSSYLLLIILIILAIGLNLLFPQRWLINLLSPGICPHAVYFKTTEEPIIALTIDDSPDANTTKDILAVLAEYQIVATFFPIANKVANERAIMEAIIGDKHEIGNHLTEDEPSIKLKENFAIELNQAHQILSAFTTVKWFRPGGGWCDRSMVKIAKRYNYQIALGSVWSYDTHIPSSRFASWFILTNTKPGSIIVLHDVAQRGTRTIATLKKVLPELQKKGYRFVTLSEMFVNNNFSQN